MNLMHLKVLGLDVFAGLEDVKKAYRRLVRENHPDLFHGEEKLERELRMMQLNDAYRQLTRPTESSEGVSHCTGEQAARPVHGWDYDLHGKNPVLSEEREVGNHKDLAYAYYKQGFIHYSRGAGGMMLKGRRGKLTPDEKGLERAREALEAFQLAHDYFRRVVEEHPESVWCADANYKLWRIKRFMVVYSRISGNISARVSGNPSQGERAG